MPHGAGLILFLHGFSHTGASWDPVLVALRESGAGVIALTPDIRGHGSASERQPVDLTAVMEDLAELISERCVVVGYSMGGRLALHLALRHPTEVERLVLIGASPGLAAAEEREARRRSDDQLADELERSSIDEFAVGWAQTPVLAGLPPAVAERARVDRLRSRPAGLARALRGLGTGVLPSLWDRLSELTMPATLVVGQRDRKFQSIAGAMAESIPRTEVVLVPGAGHAVHLEAPQRVASLISTVRRDDPR
jgi:2-succinyl-6-hydroxy-2,4-cyclohexadiene-1-carboxylate synthase